MSDIQLWVCPDCAFGFDAVHGDEGGGYSCPVCENADLSRRLAEAGRENERLKPIVDAARDWIADRQPKDKDSKVLFLAVCRAFPEDLAYKENCTCGDPEDCDECFTRDQTEAALQKLEQELALTTTPPPGSAAR